jgi:L-asparagine oxygenase
LRYSIEWFRQRPEDFPTGTLLLKNLPMDPDPGPTPADGRPSGHKTTSISEHVLIACASLHGTPFVPLQEKEGDLPAMVCPVKGSEEYQRNDSSTTRFGFHTENAIDVERRPYGIFLLCIRSDHEGVAETTSASIIEALPYISTPALDVLRRPLFQIYAPHSYNGNTSPLVVPAISGSLSQPQLIFREGGMTPLCDEAAYALKELEDALNYVTRSVCLRPGDLLLMNNFICTHGRSSFQPRWDGQDRWLMRVFTTHDWETVRQFCLPGTRHLVPQNVVHFAQNNGA